MCCAKVANFVFNQFCPGTNWQNCFFKYTTEGNSAGITVAPVNGVYTIPPEANGAIIQSALLGDVTGDGKIKSNDYKKLKSYSLGRLTIEDVGELGNLAGDLTGDGKVKSNDYKKLKSFALGRIQSI